MNAMVLPVTRLSSTCCLLLPLLLAACGRADRTITLPGPAGGSMPAGALEALEDLWSDAAPGLPEGGGCGDAADAATALAGDFNGDGTSDVVVWATVAGEPRLAAVFTRLDGEYLAVEVGDGTSRPAGVLEIGRRGSSFRLTSLTIDSFYGLDTVVVRACDGTRTAWFWTGTRFEPQPLAS